MRIFQRFLPHTHFLNTQTNPLQQLSPAVQGLHHTRGTPQCCIETHLELERAESVPVHMSLTREQYILPAPTEPRVLPFTQNKAHLQDCFWGCLVPLLHQHMPKGNALLHCPVLPQYLHNGAPAPGLSNAVGKKHWQPYSEWGKGPIFRHCQNLTLKMCHKHMLLWETEKHSSVLSYFCSW